MKSSFAILAIGATIAAAQDISSLPQCGQTCINNMLGIATSEFGCKSGDIACYCTNQRFGYGVRDCANEACSDPADAAKVIAYGTAFCQSFLASAGSTATGAATTGALAPLTSALATVSGASSLLASASDALGAGSTAITTSPLVATVVSGDKTELQTTGFATIYSALSGATDSTGGLIASATDSAGSVIASATDSAGSAIASATDSAGSAIASATESAASAVSSALASGASAASSAASAAKSAASSAASTGGAAPMVTGLPIAGAAGLAALLLL